MSCTTMHEFKHDYEYITRPLTAATEPSWEVKSTHSVQNLEYLRNYGVPTHATKTMAPPEALLI